MRQGKNEGTGYEEDAKQEMMTDIIVTDSTYTTKDLEITWSKLPPSQENCTKRKTF